MNKDKKSWTKIKPTEQGAYWVKGFNLFRQPRQQVEALVHVKMYRGKLIVNLHETNSSNEYENWYCISDLENHFQWCGPLLHNQI